MSMNLIIEIDDLESQHYGEYIIRVSNEFGEDEQNIEIICNSAPGFLKSAWLILSVSVLLVVF